MTSKRTGNIYPYLLVDEGLKKNQSSDSLRSYVAEKIAKRADIELTYIRNLQEWVDDLRPLTDCTHNGYLDTEVTRRILECMKTDVTSLAEARQYVYNELMSQAGPHIMLQRPPTGETSQVLADIEEKYYIMSQKRCETEQAYRRHKERFEHTSHQIEALESQLSQRSRLVTSRRPSSRSGPRKVDEMQEKLSKLRQQNDSELERTQTLEAQLIDLETAAEKPLTKMDEDLRRLEKTRIRYIVRHVQDYLDNVKMLKCIKSSRGSQDLLDNIESLLKSHWVDVRANARRAERGDNSKYTDLFEVNVLKTSNGKPQTPVQTNGQTGGITKGLGRENREIRDSGRHVTVTSQGPERLLDLKAPESILGHLHSHSSGSDSSVDYVKTHGHQEGTGNELSRHGNGTTSTEMYNYETSVVKKKLQSSPPRVTTSDGSIEEIELPPEILCSAEITRIDPNRQFKTRMKLAKTRDSAPTTSHVTEFRKMTKFTAEDSDSDNDVIDGNDVSNLCEVRVVARMDSYPSPGSNELQFKAGQIIKQKRGVDADGMCYGWTKESMIGRKVYGFYRPNQVKLAK